MGGSELPIGQDPPLTAGPPPLSEQYQQRELPLSPSQASSPPLYNDRAT